MVRLILLPLRLLLFPFRFAAGSAKAGYVAGRAVGLSRSIFFGLGFASGVLVASPKARKAAFAGVGRITMAVAKAQEKDDAAPVASRARRRPRSGRGRARTGWCSPIRRPATTTARPGRCCRPTNKVPRRHEGDGMRLWPEEYEDLRAEAREMIGGLLGAMSDDASGRRHARGRLRRGEGGARPGRRWPTSSPRSPRPRSGRSPACRAGCSCPRAPPPPSTSTSTAAG